MSQDASQGSNQAVVVDAFGVALGMSAAVDENVSRGEAETALRHARNRVATLQFVSPQFSHRPTAGNLPEQWSCRHWSLWHRFLGDLGVLPLAGLGLSSREAVCLAADPGQPAIVALLRLDSTPCARLLPAS